MRRSVRIIVIVVTCIGWAVCLLAAFAADVGLIPPEWERLAYFTTTVGTLALIDEYLRRPVSEIFAAGKAVGRLEAMTDDDGPDAEVIRLRERRG